MRGEKRNRLEVGEQPAGSIKKVQRGDVNPQYINFYPQSQTKSIRDLSNQVDVALSLAEYHAQLSDYHSIEAQKHRRTLFRLLDRIPRYQVQGGRHD